MQIMILGAISEQIFSILKDNILSLGHKILNVSDIHEAGSLLQDNSKVDVVILDGEKYVKESFEVLKKIQEIKKSSYLYLILLSEDLTPKNINEFISLGIDDFILKPINLNEVCTRIKTAERIILLENRLNSEAKRLRLAGKIIRGDLCSGKDEQQSLLPERFPKIPNMEFSARFIPSSYVSGDIYNVIRLDEKHVGIYNIDVSGHGVPAALFSVCLAQRMTPHLHKNCLIKVPLGKSPHYQLNAPNKVIELLDQEDLLGKYTQYFTMVYAIINSDTGDGLYCRAGHNLPLLFHRDGRSRYLRGGGLPIGLGLDKTTRKSQKIKFLNGDHLILFSDGIIDAFSPTKKQHYGFKRVQKVLQKYLHLSMETAFDHLILDLKKFQDRDEVEDDVSILGMRWVDQ